MRAPAVPLAVVRARVGGPLSERGGRTATGEWSSQVRVGRFLWASTWVNRSGFKVFDSRISVSGRSHSNQHHLR